MDVHENAGTTPHRRQLMVERLAAGWTVAAVAASFGVDPKTVRKWCYRHAAEGEAGLLDRSSRPHRSPSRLAEEAAAEIEALRRQCLPGPAIARRLGRPVSTVGLFLRRCGLGRLTALEPKPETIRYQKERPGELIHIDIKKLGRIDGVGHRITRDRAGRPGARAGSTCTSASTMLQARLHRAPARRSQESAVAFLDRALAWFASLGVTVERVMTENGVAYQEPCLPQGLPGGQAQAQAHPALHAPDQRQGRALHPDQLARMGLSPSLRQLGRARCRHAALAPRLQQHRPHSALAGKPPLSRLQGQPPWKRQLEQWQSGRRGPVRDTSSAVHGPHLAGSDTALMPYASSAEDSWARQRPAIPALPATPPSQTGCDQLRLCVP